MGALPNAWRVVRYFQPQRPPTVCQHQLHYCTTASLRAIWSATTKNNEANGENNRDGHNENISYNHGVEGETDDEEVLLNREYTSKALLASLFLSNGTPMLLAGDEFGNSQQGNNSYCQDNPITWLDWQNESYVLQDYTKADTRPQPNQAADR